MNTQKIEDKGENGLLKIEANPSSIRNVIATSTVHASLIQYLNKRDLDGGSGTMCFLFSLYFNVKQRYLLIAYSFLGLLRSSSWCQTPTCGGAEIWLLLKNWRSSININTTEEHECKGCTTPVRMHS